MPTERIPGSKVAGFRANFELYMTEFATTVTRTRRTETKDSQNRITAVTTTDTTLNADIQWVTKQDLMHLNMGDVKIGDGMLFVPYDSDIEIEDEITYNSTRWRVISQIEGEQVQGEISYLGYIIRKNAQI